MHSLVLIWNSRTDSIPNLGLEWNWDIYHVSVPCYIYIINIINIV